MPGPLQAVPVARLQDQGGFLADCAPADLVYFLLNVGDGDTQLVVLPRDQDGTRPALVVDVATQGKLPALLDALEGTPLRPIGSRFPLVVGSHPHDDHIGGMPEFLDRYTGQIDEYWDSGYYHPTAAYHETMRRLEDARKPMIQPSAGPAKVVSNVLVRALSPAIDLKNRFDTYGIDINNASVALKLEFPASRVEDRGQDRRYLRRRRTQRLILGADTQALSWGRVMLDFPKLEREHSPVAKHLDIGKGSNPLAAQIFKVSHHASKRGVSLELIECIGPKVCLVSSVAGGGKYNFPHLVALESIREALDRKATTGGPHAQDWEIGLHHTGNLDDTAAPLGSMALVVSPGGKRRLWYFGDGRHDDVVLGQGRHFVP